MNFKILPSGVAVSPSAITGIDISDVFNDKFSVTVQTSSHCYHADTFDNKFDAEKYVADLVAELQHGTISEPVNVSHKNFSDDAFVIKDSEGNVLQVRNIFAVHINFRGIYALYHFDFIDSFNVVEIDTSKNDVKKSESFFNDIVNHCENLDLITDSFAVNTLYEVSVGFTCGCDVYALCKGALFPIKHFDHFEAAEDFCNVLQQKYGWVFQ